MRLEGVRRMAIIGAGTMGARMAICPANAILAANPSGLSITAIASVGRHPECVAGMHWANPPEIVPLVEVIRGERTSGATAPLR